MKFSKLLCQTRRETPANLLNPGDQNLIRAGFFQHIENKQFVILPLGKQCLKKLQHNLMNQVNEFEFQHVQCDSPHALALVYQQNIHSYRQLPKYLHNSRQKQNNDEQSSSISLINANHRPIDEFISIESSTQDINATLTKINQKIDQFFTEIKLPVSQVEDITTDTTVLKKTAWVYKHPAGQSKIIYCDKCDYQAKQDAAQFLRSASEDQDELPLKKVATPECPTIEALATYLNIPQSQTAKAVFLVADVVDKKQQIKEELIFIVVRGDREVNETKLKRLLNAKTIRPANDDEIINIGACPGYASPINVHNARIIVDVEIPDLKNMVSGANESGYHLLNVNYSRDYEADLIADIAMAKEDYRCPNCGQLLSATTGFELASYESFDPKLRSDLSSTYLDVNGKSQPLAIGIHHIDLIRCLVASSLENSDTNGLMLPLSIAPYPIHIVYIQGKDESLGAFLERTTSVLNEAGYDHLIDDRNERPGVKFNDADLIGAPVRLTLSDRSVKNGGVELKYRDQENSQIIVIEELHTYIQNL